jgi:hypothetical protein
MKKEPTKKIESKNANKKNFNWIHILSSDVQDRVIQER